MTQQRASAPPRQQATSVGIIIRPPQNGDSPSMMGVADAALGAVATGCRCEPDAPDDAAVVLRGLGPDLDLAA
jgi:hypothetical protein